MLMCIFCTNLLRKLDKFAEQCRNAQTKMKEKSKQDTFTIQNNINNISISPTKTYYIGPDWMHLDCNIKTEECNTVYVNDDVPMLFCESSMDAEFENGTLDDSNNVNILEESNTELDIDNDPEKCGKNKKQKKVLKEGFSSRMVQETSEYTVIKLTKEQVLQELKERSKSEKYLRAPYKCESCVKGFNFEDVLQGHMEKHSQLGCIAWAADESESVPVVPSRCVAEGFSRYASAMEENPT
ncbi:hypothetical protein RR46_06997 [Papilio xuthus]|uniref:C2H2-type domain-containing protein n=1 Tax=Papilio xuthus TaxID=66420 RepID=A0A194Q4D7_PAPXU|nr:hypothetical protein RR46_06997 [Papilio xuthus]